MTTQLNHLINRLELTCILFENSSFQLSLTSVYYKVSTVPQVQVLLINNFLIKCGHCVKSQECGLHNI